MSQIPKYKIKRKKPVILEVEETVTLNEAVGIVLQDLRKNHGFTQSEVAVAIGVSRSSISNIEGGRHAVTVDTLNGFCRLYNKSSSEILPF